MPYKLKKFSNFILCIEMKKSDHAGLGGRGRVLGLRLTMLPLFTQSNIIARLPSNEKSFKLYDGFGKSALLWSFEPRNLWRKIHLWNDCRVWKKLFHNVKRNKRGPGVCIYRGSCDLINVLRWKLEEEWKNIERAREVQEDLERQNRSTWEEQHGDRRCTAKVQEMNNRRTTEALHRTENT